VGCCFGSCLADLHGGGEGGGVYDDAMVGGGWVVVVAHAHRWIWVVMVCTRDDWLRHELLHLCCISILTDSHHHPRCG